MLFRSIWRPADVPTNGVAAIKTKSKADSPALAQPAVREPLTGPELPQPSLLVESAQGFVEGWTRSQVRSAINLALLKQRYSQPAVPAPDRYSELAEALGCDSMDSHAGRIARAKRLAQKEKT